MKVRYLFGILLFGALTAGCVAQAGTEDPSASSEQGLTTTATPIGGGQQPQQPSTVSMKLRVQRAPEVTLAHGGPEQQLQGLTGLAGTDPGAPVSDDGDGKEPDPHPWHMDNSSVGAGSSH